VRAILLLLVLSLFAFAQEETCPVTKSPTVLLLITKPNTEQGTLEARATLSALDVARRMLTPAQQRTVYFQRCAASCGDPALYRWCLNITGCCYLNPTEDQCEDVGAFRCSKGVGCCTYSYSVTPWNLRVAGACPSGSDVCPQSTNICCNETGAFKGVHPEGCPEGTSYSKCDFCCAKGETEVDVPVEDCGFINQRICGLDEMLCRTGCCLRGEVPFPSKTDEKGRAFASYPLPAEGEGIEIVAFFKGDDLLMPSNSSSTFSGAFPALFTLQQCFPLLFIIGLLVAAMYASGRNPFGLLDFTARAPVPRAKIKGPAPIMVSTGLVAALAQGIAKSIATSEANKMFGGEVKKANEAVKKAKDEVKKAEGEVKGAKNKEELKKAQDKLKEAQDKLEKAQGKLNRLLLARESYINERTSQLMGKANRYGLGLLTGSWAEMSGMTFRRITGIEAISELSKRETRTGRVLRGIWKYSGMKYVTKLPGLAAKYTRPSYVMGATAGGLVRLIYGAREKPLIKAEIARKIPVIGPAAGPVYGFFDKMRKMAEEYGAAPAPPAPAWTSVISGILASINSSIMLLRLGRAQLYMGKAAARGSAPTTSAFMDGLNDAVMSKTGKMELRKEALRALMEQQRSILQGYEGAGLGSSEKANMLRGIIRDLETRVNSLGKAIDLARADMLRRRIEADLRKTLWDEINEIAKERGIKVVTKSDGTIDIDKTKESSKIAELPPELMNFNKELMVLAAGEKTAEAQMDAVKSAYRALLESKERLADLAEKHGISVVFKEGKIDIDALKEALDKNEKLSPNEKEKIMKAAEDYNAKKGAFEEKYAELNKNTESAFKASFYVEYQQIKEMSKKEYDFALNTLPDEVRDEFTRKKEAVDKIVKEGNGNIVFNPDGTINIEHSSFPPMSEQTIIDAFKQKAEEFNALKGNEIFTQAMLMHAAFRSAEQQYAAAVADLRINISAVPKLNAAAKVGEYLIEKSGNEQSKWIKEVMEIREERESVEKKMKAIEERAPKLEEQINGYKKTHTGEEIESLKRKAALLLPGEAVTPELDGYLKYESAKREYEKLNKEYSNLTDKSIELVRKESIADSFRSSAEADNAAIISGNISAAFSMSSKLYANSVFSAEEMRDKYVASIAKNERDEVLEGKVFNAYYSAYKAGEQINKIGGPWGDVKKASAESYEGLIHEALSTGIYERPPDERKGVIDERYNSLLAVIEREEKKMEESNRYDKEDMKKYLSEIYKLIGEQRDKVIIESQPPPPQWEGVDTGTRYA